MTDEGEGAQPAQIHSHAFVPDEAWWSTCAACGLSEAAHTATTLCAECNGSGGFPGVGHCGACEGTGRRATATTGAGEP